MRSKLLGLCCVIALVLTTGGVAPAETNPILFVTQVPVGGFAVLTSTFGNHLASPDVAPRGGDLVIRYPDGSLRFLTQEAGYGASGQQGANAIAVREPCVHWSGTKALFSMIVGAPTQQYQVATYHWQIYEMSGLGQGETASIRKIANQPSGYNNVSPIYATDGRIVFTSDRTPTGEAHLYPQRDEYESAFVVAGIYALDEGSGDLVLLEHAPSGSFSLSLDSFGRVIFTKWDHLQRDQQGDAPSTAANYKAFTWASEAANAATTTSLTGAEIFPEPRTENDPAYAPALATHHFNHFFPWELNQDGTAEETLNHVGRHELGGSYTDGSIVADGNLTYYVNPNLHANQLRIGGDGGLFQLREDPTHPGDFLATNAPEFGTGTAGSLMRLTGAPSVNAESMVLTALTPTLGTSGVPQQTGYFRNPLPLADGTLVAVHTAATGGLQNDGSTAAPNWSYQFRLKRLTLQNGFYAPNGTVTAGIVKSLSWYTPDVLASYNGTLWELDPVEVVTRPVPTARVATLPAIEAGVFGDEGVDVESFRTYLRQHDLALIVSRDVTQRDRADRQQPFNLRVPGGIASIATGGALYDVAYLQIFQADAVRGYGDVPSQSRGRRVLARLMHGDGVSQAPGGPASAVALGLDGSMAALVPAHRALTWQLTDANSSGVVRERNWLSFQPGEIRVCASCHGINTASQIGDAEPNNAPEALRDLLIDWKLTNGAGPGTLPTPTAGATSTPGNPNPAATPTPPPVNEVCTSGLLAVKTRLRATAASGTIIVAGTAAIPVPWVGVAPPANGMRVTIGGVLDVDVPGGAGWMVNKKGTRWRFDDPSGTHGGLRRVDLVNRSSARAPGRLVFTIRLTHVSSIPTVGALDLAVRFGAPAECVQAHWNGPTAARPRCRGNAARLGCS
jgi:Hydrazine synthase alpha subunit middle domain